MAITWWAVTAPSVSRTAAWFVKPFRIDAPAPILDEQREGVGDMAETLTELEGPAPARTERLAKRILGTSCLVLLAAGLLGLAVVGNTTGVSPAKELARIQAFVEQAKSARMTATTVSESFDGEGDLGSSYKDTSRVAGSMVLPDRTHWVEEDGTTAYEYILVPGAGYSREADTREELANEPWVLEKIEPAPATTAGVDPDLQPAADVAAAFGAFDFVDMLDAAEAPTRLGPHTIKVRLDASKIEAFASDEDDAPLPKMTAELTSTSDGRLDRLVLHFEEKDPDTGQFMGTLDMRFTDWGKPVTIEAPDAAAIDATPEIAENALAAFDATPLYGLRRLPAGYALLAADVFTTEDDADLEAGDCPEVSLSYGNPAEHEAAEAASDELTSEEDFVWPTSIEVGLTPADCDAWSAFDAVDGDAITVGGRPATIFRSENTDEEYATSIQVIVGATRVIIESDGPEAATLAAASDIVPFDLATQPVHREAPPAR
jgi:hypothetical protein